MRRKLRRLDLGDGILNELPKLAPAIVRNRAPQVLDLGQALADEDDEGYLGFTGQPGVAGQLRIKRQQAFRLVRIPGRGGLPIDDAARPVEITECEVVGN